MYLQKVQRGFAVYKGKWKVPESLKGAQDCIRKVWRLISLHWIHPKDGSAVSLWMIAVVWEQTSKFIPHHCLKHYTYKEHKQSSSELCRWNISLENAPWFSCLLSFHELCDFFFPGRLQITGQRGTEKEGENSWDAEKCISFKSKDCLVLPIYFYFARNVMGL